MIAVKTETITQHGLPFITKHQQLKHCRTIITLVITSIISQTLNLHLRKPLTQTLNSHGDITIMDYWTMLLCLKLRRLAILIGKYVQMRLTLHFLFPYSSFLTEFQYFLSSFKHSGVQHCICCPFLLFHCK